MKKLLILLVALSLSAFAQGKGKGHNKHADVNRGDNDNYRVFSTTQRDHISSCLNNTAGLPPGLAKRESLPPGLQKQLDRTGKLPPGLQKKVQPLPSQCQINLPKLPTDWQRVVLGDRVIVLDPAKRIIDWFNVALGRPRER
jgi:hypothetical protein